MVNEACKICGTGYSKGLKFTTNGDGTCRISGIGTCTDTDVNIPPTSPNGDNVTGISSNAFSWNGSNITNITIPDSVIYIGYRAFSNTQYYNDESNWENDVLYINNFLIDTKTSISGEYVIKDGTRILVDRAFANRTSLTSVTIPDSVISIGSYAFYSCDSLKSITVDENNHNYESIDGNLYTKGGKTLVRYAIGKADTSFVIPDSVTSIGDDAFYKCTSLTNITIPDSVTSIGSRAFYNCYRLSSVIIPDSVTGIGSGAFEYCFGLSNIVIGNNVTSIGSGAFYNCYRLSSVIIPDSVTSIGGVAFEWCINLASVTIGSGVTSIGDCAFNACEKLIEVYNLSSLDITKGSTDNGNVGCFATEIHTSTDIDNKVWTDKDGYIFYEGEDACYLLGYVGTETDLFLPESCNGKNYSIYERAFYNHSYEWDIQLLSDHYVYLNYTSPNNITSVIISDGVTSIGYQAFEGCTKLTSITIGRGITSISRAFYYCFNLVEVYNLSSLNITEKTFTTGYGYPLNIYTPTSGESKVWSDSDGYIFYEDGDTCYLIGYKGNDVDLILPNSCNRKEYAIRGYAFSMYHSTLEWGLGIGLKSITIPDSVTVIGEGAFWGCFGITKVSIGNRVVDIGEIAFSDCWELASITIPDGVTRIGSDAFINTAYSFDSDNWEDYDFLYIGNYLIEADSYFSGQCVIKDGTKIIADCAFDNCNSLTSVTIPDSVTSIGGCAFRDCNSLTSVTIPDSVTSIGDSAFRNCNSLTDVYYTGSEEEWSNITIGYDDGKLTNATIHYNYAE